MQLTTEHYKLFLIVIGNVSSSVAIVMLNKLVVHTLQFPYVLLLTLIHFVVTTSVLELLAYYNLITVKRLPISRAAFYAILNVSAISFMNLSLLVNSVGFYQMIKLLCVPCMVVIEVFMYSSEFSKEILLSLLAILIGVGLVVVREIQANSLGVVYGAFAVICSAFSQINLGRGQALHEVSALQMLHSIMLPQSVFQLFFSVPIDVASNVDDIASKLSSNYLLLAVIGISGLVSLLTNLFSIALLGATSAITSQVIGHTKTCLILLFGLIFFPSKRYSTSDVFREVGGSVLALTGVVWYTYNKNLAQQQQQQQQSVGRPEETTDILPKSNERSEIDISEQEE